jgi:hypothetical protein
LKKWIALVLLVVTMTGCTGENRELEQMMSFRAKLLAGLGCSFDSVITADYGEEIYTFHVSCRGDEWGNLTFTVTEPESISGITGKIDGEGGKLTFDDQALAFAMLADGQITPVSAPWLLLRALRGGYVSFCGREENSLRVSIRDSYEEDTVKMDIWFHGGELPTYGEIIWDGRKILSIEISKFEIL